MPSKSRRVAARQTQMTSKRKRKAQAHAAGTPPPQEPVATDDVSDAAAAQPAAAPTQATAAARPKGGFRSRGQARAAAEATPLTFNYVGPEIRRIGIVAAIMVAILLVLTFVLR